MILATGTFMSGLVHIGHTAFKAGRAGEFASYALPEHLRALGLKTGRMKTGTPPRLRRGSIDFSCFTTQEEQTRCRPFSHFSQAPSMLLTADWVTKSFLLALVT